MNDAEFAETLRNLELDTAMSPAELAAIERAIYVLEHWEWMDGYARGEVPR